MYRVLMGELVELNMVSPPELTVRPFNSIRIRLAERFGGASEEFFCDLHYRSKKQKAL